MRITLICVGKIKEKFYRDAISEYSKRLSKYCSFEIIEVQDEMTPDRAGDNECELIKEKEAGRIISKIRENTYLCTLEINGEKYSSEKFAQCIEKAAVSGKSHITFVIGGSLGLHRTVTDRADWHLSFSDMTFPHQLMRVILSEQIYRAFRIINNEPYHK
jgi:23S rRNA (pseudouridine1915-N3)-methyltransferase